jgi:hypothetical protein
MHSHLHLCTHCSTIRSHGASVRIAVLSFLRALCVLGGLFAFAMHSARAEVRTWQFEATVVEVDNSDIVYGDVRLGDTMRGTFRYDLSVQPDSRSALGKSFYGHPASFEGVHLQLENPRTETKLEWLPDTSNPADAYWVRVETNTSVVSGSEIALVQTMKRSDQPAPFWLVIQFESPKVLPDIALPSQFNLDDWALAGVYMTDLEFFNGLAAEIYSLTPLAEPAVPGDFDADGDADTHDYALWRANFGSTDRLDADANGNAVVDAADYLVWRHSMGSFAAGNAHLSHASVPEPAYLHFLAAASIAIISSMRAGALRRRRNLKTPITLYTLLVAVMIAVAICPLPPATAGVVADKGDAFWWVSDHQLGAANNDDFMGEFAANLNHVSVNSFSEPDRERQPIDALERIVPTAPSGGITEYAMTLGGNQPERTPGSDFLLRLDNKYIIELGFGTGDRFVPARLVDPLLRFDAPGMVSPVIENYKPIPPAIRPLLELIEHRGDSLLLQGRHNLGNFRIASFATGSLFVLPLDIPDLPLSARAHYSEAELAGLSNLEVPFTIRMHIVPEPATLALAVLGLIGMALITMCCECSIVRFHCYDGSRRNSASKPACSK